MSDATQEQHSIARTLRQRPLLSEYSVSEAYNACDGIKDTLRSMNRTIILQRAEIDQLKKTILEMRNGDSERQPVERTV